MVEESIAWHWDVLEHLGQSVGETSMASAFADDPDRARRMTRAAAGITLDLSKQRVDDSVLGALYALAEASGFEERRRAMFAGEPVNVFEDRAAWHVALRRPETDPLHDGVHEVRVAMGEFCERVRAGDWTGYTGAAITDLVNIGIGGSDFGPRMVVQALARTSDDGPQAHFVANVDPADLNAVLAHLDPARTLFVVTSKTFTTAETLANAHAARRWLLASGATEADVEHHFVAVSTNREAVSEFGIDTMFGFWDWVGGRFSLWSAVGLSIALSLGMDTFDELLAGAHAMDRHFESAPLTDNLPAALALVGIWNRNILKLPSVVVAPYSQRLVDFPGWLQQLEMESNGKSITEAGAAADHATVPVVWGSVGTNAQHAYFQMLHQGDLLSSVDFVLPLATPDSDDPGRERQRLANCLAQAEALMCGRAGGDAGDDSALAAARACPGNRPSNMLLLERLDARHLGALLAAYEHKVFVQGLVWQIDSFDQWGVELGKTLAKQLERDIAGDGDPADHDASTAALIERVRAL